MLLLLFVDAAVAAAGVVAAVAAAVAVAAGVAATTVAAAPATAITAAVARRTPAACSQMYYPFVYMQKNASVSTVKYSVSVYCS